MSVPPPRLFDVPCGEASPEAAIKAVFAFVERCRAYADAEIARREGEGRDATAWRSYRQFSEHTLQELREGTLDGWFREA